MVIDIGCGESVLTPPLGARIPGYFHERLAAGVHDQLYVKALLFGSGEGERVLLLCFDLIALEADRVASIRAAAAGAAGLPSEAVMVSATHTHTGGATRGRWLDDHALTASWAATLPERAAEAARQAAEQCEPCELQWGQVQEDRIAFNRRYCMANGMVMSNPGRLNPEIIAPAGPIDPNLTTVVCRRADGTAKALLVHYSCHLDNVGGDEISADYPGYLTRRLRERLPDRPSVFYLQGACGDINHIDVRSTVPRKGHEHSRWMGETLAGDVCVALGNAPVQPVPAGPVGAQSLSLALPLREGTDPAAGRAEVQAVRIGGLGIVGIPAEYFVELQLDIRERSPFDLTLVAELTNGWIGYVPTRKAFEENMRDVPAEAMDGFDNRGYEVRSALSRGLLPGCGEALADAAVQVLRRLSASGSGQTGRRGSASGG